MIWAFIANSKEINMEQTRCPYCHNYVETTLLPAHIAQHRSQLPDGQQQDYVTLPPEERDSGELTGVPVAYVHKTCGVGTRMPDEIVRSYLINPYLYLADTTFCVGCGKQVPYTECHWSKTGENLQTYFDALRAAKPECRPASYATKNLPVQNPSESQPSSFSGSRVALLLATIIGGGLLTSLSGMLKNDAKQAEQVPPNVQMNENVEEVQWSEKIKRGEDVPEAVLMLAGIKPEKYKEHQTQLKVKKLQEQGLIGEAIKAMDDALVEIPESQFLHNAKAWILATSTDDTVRNGKLAVEHATKACELSEFSDPSDLDTLAAAHAEAGEFDLAIKQIEAAMGLTTDAAQKQRFAARLELYKNHEPFHQ